MVLLTYFLTSGFHFDKLYMIKLANYSSCTACASCINICGKQAIAFKSNDEGFFKPFIDKDKCIECGLCMKVCPQLNESETKKVFIQKSYAVISKRHQKNGSSGGVFSAIADYVLDNQGIVYGAAFNSSLKLKHIAVIDKSGMQQLRGSKYLQSDIGFCFKDIRNQLLKKKLVLFSGTPCQVAGLNTFLRNKNYENLITIDLTCHGVPSQTTFDVWLKHIKNHYGEIKGLQFRKLDGWSITPYVTLKNGKKKYIRNSLETYMWAFYNGLLFKEACYNCKYANLNRPADITLADFWGIGNHGTPYSQNTTHGISLVITNSQKGDYIIQSIKESLIIEKRSINEALIEQYNLKHPSPRPSKRNTSVIDFNSCKSLKEFARSYNLLPNHWFFYIATSQIKNWLIQSGLFDKLKNIKYKI